MLGWQKEIAMAEDRERQQRSALNNPFGMLVHAINTDTEQAKLSYFGSSDRIITVTHPFRGVSSWIRAIPEEGTTYLAAFRADEANPQLMNTVTRNSLFFNDAYRKGTGVYRPLYPGEIEISAKGYSQAYFSRKPKLELRGGTIHRWADQEKMTSGDRSLIHTRQLLQYRSNEHGEEEKLGIVSRPKIKKEGGYSSWEITYPKVGENHAAEHYMMLKNPSNQNPTILFQTYKGQVIDKDGKQITQSRTQIPLRFFEEYFANDDSSTRFEIDEKGNYYTELADAAREGYELYVPTGNYKKTIGLDEIISIEGNVQRNVEKSATYQIGNNWQNIVRNDYSLQSENGQMNFVMKSGSSSQMVFSTRNHFIVLDDGSAPSIYIIHNTGSQTHFDSQGSVKTVSSKGEVIYLDAVNNAITASTSRGAFVTLKDNIVISDATGGQVLSFDGKNTVQMSASSNINLIAQSVNLACGSVSLGNGAILSVALAEPLAVLFDTHTHATILGPTSPPSSPTTAALANSNPVTAFASAFVKVRTNLAG